MSVFGSSVSAKQSPCDCAQLAHLKYAYRTFCTLGLF